MTLSKAKLKVRLRLWLIYSTDITHDNSEIFMVLATGKTTCGLYYKSVTIVIDPPSVIKVTLQIVASLTIIIDDAI
jgi:hypothetical protein